MASTRTLSSAILRGLSPPLPHYSTAEFTLLACHRTGPTPVKVALLFCFKGSFEDQETIDMVWERNT